MPDLAALIRAFGDADVTVSPEELLDALYLYQIGMRAPATVADGLDRSGDRYVRPPVTDPPAPTEAGPIPSGGSRTADPAELPADPRDTVAGVYLPQPGWSASGPGGGPAPGVSAQPVQAPTVPALRDKLALSRALRPLKRTHPSPSRRTLDVPQTARRIAMTGRIVPASRPAPERWLDVALVVDRSDSHAIWEDTVRETRTLLENHGAFRCLHTWYLHPTASGGVELTVPGGRALAKGALVPSPRRLVMILTDGTGRLWEGLEVREYVRYWATHSPVVILQLLPEDLWHRTAVNASPVVFHPAAPGPGSRLEFTDSYGQRTPATHMAIPVVEVSKSWVEPWSRIIAATGDAEVSGAAWLIARKPPPARAPSPVPPPAGAPRVTSGGSPARPRDTILGFRGESSDDAYQLARFLSVAGGPLTLPVMRLIQAAMLPGSEPSHLAEIYLSGLIKRVDPDPGDAGGPDWFAFADDVGAGLRAGVHRSELRGSPQVIGQFMASRWNGLGTDFAALLELGADERGEQLSRAPKQLARLTRTMLDLMNVEYSLPAPPPPVRLEGFVLARHPADTAWADWIVGILRSFGCTVREAGWGAGRVPPGTPEWTGGRWKRLALITGRCVRDTDWLDAALADGRAQAPHLLWVPPVNLPAPLRRAAFSILGPGNEEASVQTLRGLITETRSRGRVMRAGASSGDVEQDLTATVPLTRFARVFPGAPGFVHNLPERRPYLLGRSEELTAIHDALRREQPGGPHLCVVAGPLGVGKTEIVVEYAYEHAAEYQLVWMVRADDPDTLRTDLAGFAAALAAHPSYAGRGGKSAAGPAPWSDPPPGCLLIYHRAAAPIDLAEVWPGSGGGHVLVTTWSAAAWSGLAPGLELGPLPTAAAREIVRLGLTDFDEWDTAEQDAVPVLLDAYGGSPLAIDQALRSMRTPGGPSAVDLVERIHELRPPPPSDFWATGRAAHAVGLVGGAGSGKTTFAFALPVAVHQAYRSSGETWTVVPGDQASLDLVISHQRALQADRTFPEPTAGLQDYFWLLRGGVRPPAPRTFFPGRRKDRSDLVELFLRLRDVPGGYYSGLPSIWASGALDDILGAGGLILLVDPESGSITSQLNLLQGMLARLTTGSGHAMADGRLPQRLAVCVSKFDRAPLLKLAQDGGLLSTDEFGDPCLSASAAADFFALLCRSLGPDALEMLRIIRAMFDPRQVRYFATSSVGFHRGPWPWREVDPRDAENREVRDGVLRVRGDIRPINVLEPVLWAGSR
jgi:hypothetical protein